MRFPTIFIKVQQIRDFLKPNMAETRPPVSDPKARPTTPMSVKAELKANA